MPQHLQADTSWWDRLIAGLSRKDDSPPPPRPAPPKVDEAAWAKNVERARISPQLTVHDLGLIVFGETQSYSDRPDSNEPIVAARQKLAHSVINADHKWRADRQKWANTARPIEPSENVLRNPAVRTAYESSMTAAREAYLSGSDPTNGAVYLNQRKDASRANRVLSRYKPQGVRLSTQSGPYNNSFPNEKMPSRIAWLDTYYPPGE
jgi:hypothetical protein